jgi:hypothetical protein
VLTVGHLQQREGHWAIVDLRGKAGHVRTIPVPDWVPAVSALRQPRSPAASTRLVRTKRG